MCGKPLGTLGSTANEIWQFRHMGMADIIIPFVFFSESRSVNNSFQQADLGLGWDSTPQFNCPEETNQPPGADFANFSSRYCYEM